jgi:hypothetical protein
MLYELARRLKEQGRSAAEIRAELLKVGANAEEVTVLLGSLGCSAQPHATAPELLTRTARVTGSRWTLGLLLLLFILGAVPLFFVLHALLDAVRVGR